MLPDTKEYLTVFTYEESAFDISTELQALDLGKYDSSLTGQIVNLVKDKDYFVDGRYVIPLNKKAEAAMLVPGMYYRKQETANKKAAAEENARVVLLKAEERKNQDTVDTLDSERLKLEQMHDETSDQKTSLTATYQVLATTLAIQKTQAYRLKLEMNVKASELTTAKAVLSTAQEKLKLWNDDYGGIPDDVLSDEQLQQKQELEAAVETAQQDVEQAQKDYLEAKEQYTIYNDIANASQALYDDYGSQISDLNKKLKSIEASQETNLKNLTNAKDLLASVTRDREKAEAEAARLEALVVSKPFSTATVRTKTDGLYEFTGLPLIDESVDVTDSKQLIYRIVIEREANSEFSYYNVEQNQRDGNDSDAGAVLTDDIYPSMSLSDPYPNYPDYTSEYGRQALDRVVCNTFNSGTEVSGDPNKGRMGASDEVQLVKLSTGSGNGYVGKFLLSGNQDNTAVLDVGLLSYPKTALVGNRVWDDANENGIQDAGEKGIAGLTVTLYQYSEDYEFNYYPYEVVTTTTSSDTKDTTDSGNQPDQTQPDQTQPNQTQPDSTSTAGTVSASGSTLKASTVKLAASSANIMLTSLDGDSEEKPSSESGTGNQDGGSGTGNGNEGGGSGTGNGNENGGSGTGNGNENGGTGTGNGNEDDQDPPEEIPEELVDIEIPEDETEDYLKPIVSVVKLDAADVTVTGGWIPVQDADGKMTVTTDANGYYSFRVPITDMTDPTEVYRYRVMVTQDENVLDGIYAWSRITATPEVDLNSDVIASSDFIDNSTSTVSNLSDGTNSGSLTGKYDALGNAAATNTEPVPTGYSGIVVGMLTDQYRDSISNEFVIYDADEANATTDTTTSATSTKARAKAKAANVTASILNFKYVKDDMTQDAGIIRKFPPDDEKTDKTTPKGPENGSNTDISKKKHHHHLGNGLLNLDLTLPPTGGSLAALGVLLLALIGAIGFILTGKKKKKKKDGENEEDTT
jgi:hypothetical protein